jgi:hypothetical protein
MSNKHKWKALSPESEEAGVSAWKTIEQIKSIGLRWSNGNGNQRHGKFFGLTRYLWESERDKGKVIKLRTVGFDPDIEKANLLKNRPIAPRIRQHFKSLSCIACGSNESMVVDHKNDLYNDARVHSFDTQLITDFQPLCNKCNLEKRTDCRKTKEQNKRQPAPFQCIQMGGPAFIEGDETFDSDGLGMKGTFWYDIEAYFAYNQKLHKKS